MEVVYKAKLAAQHGTQLHEFAAQCIKLRQRLEDTQQTLNLYVNDAIGFRMIPEQVLFVTMDAFGTADAISFRDNYLRIHDLKTGMTDTSWRQLEVYAAFFCIEYGHDPFKLEGMEFRIYQNDTYKHMFGDPQVIMQIMDTTRHLSKMIPKFRSEVE